MEGLASVRAQDAAFDIAEIKQVPWARDASMEVSWRNVRCMDKQLVVVVKVHPICDAAGDCSLTANVVLDFVEERHTRLLYRQLGMSNNAKNRLGLKNILDRQTDRWTNTARCEVE